MKVENEGIREGEEKRESEGELCHTQNRSLLRHWVWGREFIMNLIAKYAGFYAFLLRKNYLWPENGLGA